MKRSGKASKRIFGLAEFRFYDVAEGIPSTSSTAGEPNQTAARWLYLKVRATPATRVRPNGLEFCWRGLSGGKVDGTTAYPPQMFKGYGSEPRRALFTNP